MSCPIGCGVVDRASAYGTSPYRYVSDYDTYLYPYVFSPLVYKVVGKEMEPVIIKLHDLVSPSGKNCLGVANYGQTLYKEIKHVLCLLSDFDSSVFPEFFHHFLGSSNDMNQPELENHDTALHIAFRERKFNALIKMIQNGGNPFLKNKEGLSIEMMAKSLSDADKDIREVMMEEIDSFNTNYPLETKRAWSIQL